MSDTAPVGEASDQSRNDADSRIQKVMAAYGWSMLLSPLLPNVVLILYALIAWYQVGHFPYYGHPDPKEMGSDLLHAFVFLFSLWGGVLTLFASIGSVPIMFIVGRAMKAPTRYLAISLIAVAFHIWLITADPLGLWEWIAD